MEGEKLALRRRIDTLDEYANRLHATLTEQEREIARLTAELETVKRERDALKRDLYMRVNGEVRTCHICEFLEQGEETCDREVEMEKCFVWRGLCAENGGAEDGK